LRRMPPHYPGKMRFARWALASTITRTNVIVDVAAGLFIVPHLAEPVAFNLLVNGVYEPETAGYLVSHLQLGDVVVDIGANIGTFSLMAARLVGSSGRVLAIEASPKVFPYLAKNIEMSQLGNIQAFHCAAANRNAESVSFWEAPDDKFGMGALAPQFNTEPCRIAAYKLDDLLRSAGIKQVAVIKLDVEGAEANVLQGALDLLQNSVAPAVVFEFCDWAEARFPGHRPGDAQRLLMDLGYEIWRLNDFDRGGQPIPEPLSSGFGMLVATRMRTGS